MNSKFLNLSNEKQDKIINAALKEFGENSFEKASTNNIVKYAEISKGTLFNYFNSKQELYDYLIDFSFSSITEVVLNDVDLNNPDLFERIKQIGISKIKYMSRYPYMLNFTKKYYERNTLEEIKELAEKYAPNIYTRVYSENIDFTLFKEGTNIEKAIKVTQWSIEKLGDELLLGNPCMDNLDEYKYIVSRIDDYLDFLKKSFYD